MSGKSYLTQRVNLILSTGLLASVALLACTTIINFASDVEQEAILMSLDQRVATIEAELEQGTDEVAPVMDAQM